MADDIFRPGELVYAAEDLYNDGGLPDVDEGALVASAGARGVVVKAGHVEAIPETAVYLVRFEVDGDALGLPVGCLADELARTPPALAAP